MVAVFDIGNTNIHMGLYEGEELIKEVTCPSTAKLIENKFVKILAHKKLEGIAIASVIPHLTSRFVQCLKKRLSISSLIISSKLNCHLTFNYYNPETLGADRIANVVGGLERYKRDMIVIGFGTVTTIDVVLKNGNYLGGLIIPGIRTSLEMLFEKTALLPKTSLKKSTRGIIGRSTEECIQSGVLNGTVAMIKGLIAQIKKETRKKFLCTATGGWSKFMSSKIEEIKHVDPDLCLYGIFKIYGYNV